MVIISKCPWAPLDGPMSTSVCLSSSTVGVWTKLNCQLRKISNNAFRWGSLIKVLTVVSDSSVPFSEFLVCVVNRHWCLFVWSYLSRPGVFWHSRKVSWNVNDPHILFVPCGTKLALRARAGFLNISIEFLSKRWPAFQESTTRWRGTSNWFGWFVFMTHYLDVVASDSSLTAACGGEAYSSLKIEWRDVLLIRRDDFD